MTEINWTILISVLTCILPILWAVLQYLDTRKREQKLKEFDNYHKLIKELVEGNKNGNPFIDRQAAIVYELRHFKRYYPFSYRTLLSLKELWGNRPDTNKRLIEEFDLTIKYLDTKCDVKKFKKENNK